MISTDYYHLPPDDLIMENVFELSLHLYKAWENKKAGAV